MGERIFVQSDERSDDGFKSLSDRAGKIITTYDSKEDYAAQACATWFDVRAFGQVFDYKNSKDKGKDKKSNDKGKDGVSVSVRGPVSIHQAISISPVDINSIQITKSVNSEPTDDGKKSSDTMGSKYLVEFGLYKIKGAINVQLAEKTGFTEGDAQKIKECLRTLFVNDSSSARPDGSMEVLNSTGGSTTIKPGNILQPKYIMRCKSRRRTVWPIPNPRRIMRSRSQRLRALNRKLSMEYRDVD